jgi:hypothetical protein
MPLKMIVSTALLLFLACPAFSQDPNTNLIEASNRVAASWRTIFAACSDPKFPRGVLYAEFTGGPMKGSVLQIGDPSLQFQTESIDTVAVLNGMEFSATSILRAAVGRNFDRKSGWTAWKKAAEFTVSVRKENGKWSVQPPEGVSYAPPPVTGGPETILRALPCDRAPK